MAELEWLWQRVPLFTLLSWVYLMTTTGKFFTPLLNWVSDDEYTTGFQWTPTEGYSIQEILWRFGVVYRSINRQTEMAAKMSDSTWYENINKFIPSQSSPSSVALTVPIGNKLIMQRYNLFKRLFEANKMSSTSSVDSVIYIPSCEK